MSIKKSLFSLKERLLLTIKSYPLASLFATIATLASIFQIHYSHSASDSIALMVYALSFGFFLLVAIGYYRRDLIAQIIVVAITLLFWLSLTLTEYRDSVLITKFIVLIAIALLLLVVLPFVQQRDSNLKFWAWLLNILLALSGALAFGLILFGALAGAMRATDTLFDLSIKAKYYGDLFALIMGIFSTHYLLVALAKNPQDINIGKEFYGRVGKFFVKYILTPITYIYAIILIVYLAKILFTMEWPNGILVWLSLVFASLSLATYLSWTPFGNSRQKALLIVALVQMSMLFIAIYMRISQYGWSSGRYFVVMVGVWFVLTFLYLIYRKNARYELPFMSLAILLFVSQYGWGLSAHQISNVSQTNRYFKLINNNPNLSDRSPQEIRCHISRSLDYLSDQNSEEYLIKTVPKIATKYYKSNAPTQGSFASFATEELGFEYLPKFSCRRKGSNHTGEKIKFSSQNSIEKFDISGYDTLHLNYYYSSSSKRDSDNRANWLIINDDKSIIGEFDLSSLVENLIILDDNKSGTQNASQEQLTFRGQNDKIAIKILIDYIYIHKKEKKIDYFSGKLLTREINKEQR